MNIDVICRKNEFACRINEIREKCFMKILVIGNGFDLAHGLPTRYGDFLEFCEKARRIYTFREDAPLSDYKSKNIDNWKMDDYIKNILSEAYDKRNCKVISTGGITYRVEVTTPNKLLDELYEHIGQNTWLKYFLKCHSFVRENWIDFESEISRVIQSLDTWRFILENGGSKEELPKEKQEVLMSICKVAKGSMRESMGSVQAIDKFTKFLNVELEKLIRALEIYIAEFVAKIKIPQRDSDIEKLNIGHVLSFNYSDTYKNLYGVDKKIRYDYIHGRADINNTVESNNMVLGIDEYLTKKKRNKETKFIAFK